MTTRKTLLLLLGVLSFAAAGAWSPPPVHADDSSGSYSRPGHQHNGRFGQRLRERRQQRQQQNSGGYAGQQQAQPDSSGQQQDSSGLDNTGAGGDFHQRKAQLREELMQLPPDQRRQRIQELKQQMSQDKQQTLEERKQQFQDKWDQASPEQKAKFCDNVQQKCSSGSADSFACQVAQGRCSGQGQ